MNKIYIASSWKNAEQVQTLAAQLREVGFQVDDFTDDSRGRFVFHYSEFAGLEELDAISFLQHDQARRAFNEDKKWLDWADAVVLLLPAGRSAHLEAGYAKGCGKRLVIYQPGRFPTGEFDVMYGFADLITASFADMVAFLAEPRKPEGSPVIIDMGKLEDWPITHLRRACQKNKVKGYSTMSRSELVQEVRNILNSKGGVSNGTDHQDEVGSGA
ncbi:MULTISPECIES: hypothetical protein [Paenibacillus]|uniref:Uncharacterized protein n=1 Tax=Paenibacillus macerans TaxID=44252 RepID=A0A090ZSZ5_PAEMA|nr:hypothetical protein [Paenibacillus macerans]KFN07251.1 hypothetical protein DJ90_5681 [Paenibacillus macerans]MCY7558236.1 hypothetical protein [Paenibacillus macerans]MEC0154626.1 hypothetical protein [Paenibacillus macerans]SUA85642.1 Uncharacterised protein [Paenibacillus macerans]